MHAEPGTTEPPTKDHESGTSRLAVLQGTGFMLSTAGRILRERFERALAATGLRARHLGVLVSLDVHGPMPQGAVGENQWADKSTMVAVVDDLETWGFVERRRSARDRRAYDLTLTAAGAAKLADVIATVPGLEEKWLAPLDADEREQLRLLLARLLYAPGGLMPDEA